MHDIHRVRVGIKRIKAVHRMLGSSFPERFKAKALNKPYKIVFRTLGVYRETLISINLIKKIVKIGKIRKAYHSYLKPSLSIMEDEIAGAITNFEFNPESEESVQVIKTLNDLSLEDEVRILTSYIDNQRLKAKLLLNESEGYNELHSIRILLKNIKPFLKLLATQELSRFTTADFSRLNRTESIIGKWHDKSMLYVSLEEFEKKNSKDAESWIRSYMRLLGRIEKQEIRQLSGIRASVASCLSSLSPVE